MSPVRWDTVAGHRRLWLENDLLAVSVLPDKGADIYELIHKASGVDCLVKTPWGLQPPGDQPPQDFLDNYEGGWQELFPSSNDACTWRGQPIPFHGEAPLLSWAVEEVWDVQKETVVRMAVCSRVLPLRLERTMRLRRDEPVLLLDERVENLGDEPAPFTWGHHLVLGAPFLAEGCIVEAPARTIISPDNLYEPETAVVAPGQREAWPFARGRAAGQRVDLRQVRGPEAGSHDDVYLADLERGCLRVDNPELKLTVTLDWDAAVFPFAVLWMAYGGALAPPLTGMYCLGVEPWLARYELARSVENGEARTLAPGEALETQLRVTYGPSAEGGRGW